MKKYSNLFYPILFLVVFILVLTAGCRKTPTDSNPRYTTSEITINPAQYSTRYYFVDTLYRKFYEPLRASLTPEITVEMGKNHIEDIEVWVSRQGVLPVEGERNVNAYINLPKRRVSDPFYPESYDTLDNPIDGESRKWKFIKLEQTQFTVDRIGGFVGLNLGLSDDQTFAVAYRISGASSLPGDDLVCGEFADSDSTGGGILILKLIRPSNLLPHMRPAWDLQLKNVYPVGGHISKEGLAISVFYRTPDIPDAAQIQGRFLLQVLGWDRYDMNNYPSPDYMFDYIPGLTVNEDRGELIFPSLRPFDSTIVDYFKKMYYPLESDSLLFSEVYDTTKTAAYNSPKNRYKIVIVKRTEVLD